VSGEIETPDPTIVGRPRMRDSSSWWHEHGDGQVSLHVLRRVGAAEGSWLELVYRAETEAAALALYDADCRERLERSLRLAARRAKWGPTELRSLAVVEDGD
jgi:hypothetical protein